MSAANAAASDPAIYAALRAKALGTTPADLGLNNHANSPFVYGIVLDMAIERGTATLVGYDTGDASLYLSNGGAVIGGIAHSEVRRAARAWVRTAQEKLELFSQTKDYPLPSTGQAVFYLLTDRGVTAARAPEEVINSGRLTISPIWYAGQALLAELRRSTTIPGD